MAIACQLAKAGWWGGDPSVILKAPADVVMSAVHYANFVMEYERAVLEMNRGPA